MATFKQFGVSVLETVMGALGAVIGWLWETWKDWWLIIIFVAAGLFTLYVVTKPGWDEVAKGKPFFLSEFESRNRIVLECLESELYTRQECILLASGKRR